MSYGLTYLPLIKPTTIWSFLFELEQDFVAEDQVEKGKGKNMIEKQCIQGPL